MIMPTTLLLPKLAAVTAAAVAAALAGVTVWVTPPVAASPASVIRNDEFSAPAAGQPRPIEVVVGPQSSRGLRRVPCAGHVSTASCYIPAP